LVKDQRLQKCKNDEADDMFVDNVHGLFIFWNAGF
jgi:hypothetical protein